MKSSLSVRIGNQTAASAPALGDPFEFAVANGFRAFEWFPDKTWTEADLDAPARRAIREEARRNDIRLSVHAPLGVDLLNPESSTPAEPALELAQAIGAEVYNLHLQAESGIENFLTAIESLIRRTRELGLQLSLENTPVTGPADFNEFFRLLRERPDLPAQHVGLCFDLGHANLCEATRNDYLAFLDRLGPHVPINHLHIHENHGDCDAHLPLFTGPSGEDDRGIRGFLERLARRGFAGSAIMEVWPDPPSQLVESRDRLEVLLSDASPPEPGSGDRTRKARTEPDLPIPPPPEDAGGSDPFIAELALADRNHRSWREKLQWIEQRLSADEPPGPEDLAALAVYLRWLHTGRIACEEDSRHFRPSHHARTGAAIEERLEALKTPDTAPVIRRIYPYLPSYDTPFTRAEPLTRIRDIAHRNDIPKELKEEIKHRLQNKLHRCAGPEDLATSAELLERVTSGEYSGDFVAEFRTFHEELKSFFNAQSLVDRLAALKPNLPPETRARIDRLPAESGKEKRSLRDALGVFRSLTDLRAEMIAWLPEADGAAAQSARLAEIGLEAFAFPVASDLINRLEKQKTVPWPESLDALSLALTHLGLSETFPGESAAVRNEVDAVRAAFAPDDPIATLRLKASLDRTQRLCDRVADFVLGTFHERAELLGKSLGVPEADIGLFCEAEVRQSLIFQLSKLTAFLAGRLRAAAGWSDWEAIVPGRAAGRFVRVADLNDFRADGDESNILLLDRASGDEDMPPGVAGIVLAQAIPHLSHLSVRARQAQVPFLCSESPDQLASLKASLGQTVRLEVSAETFGLALLEGDPEHRAAAAHPGIPAAAESPDLETGGPVLPLSEVTAANAGAKADGLRRLAALAGESRSTGIVAAPESNAGTAGVPPDGGQRSVVAAPEPKPGIVAAENESARCRTAPEPFTVPPTRVVPFGVLASALRNRPEIRDLEIDRLHELPENDHASRLTALRKIILELPVPEEILAAAAEIDSGNALIARSSASAEDAENGAGAGIYASIPNLSLDRLASGIREVWASLWTDKAWANRRNAGNGAVPHMAVVIQPLHDPAISFIVHTTNPVSRDKNEVYIEAALGSGEILAGAAEPGTPYRFAVDAAGNVRVLAFGSFSHRLVPGESGRLERRVVDYSRSPLTCDTAFRDTFSRRLAAIAREVEDTFGGPQDIEGFLLDEQIHLVQSRPQQGVG